MAKEEKRTRTAIDAKRGNVFFVDPDEVVLIGRDTKDGAEHPLYRASVHSDPDPATVKNIKAIGILQPIKVRKNGEKLEAVFGRKRTINARQANKELKEEGAEEISLPVIVVRGDDSLMLGISAAENLLRKEDSLLEQASVAQRLINMGRSDAEVATFFGMSVVAVRNRLALLDLDKRVQKLIEDGKMSASAAAKLATLPREEQVAAAEKLVESGEATHEAAVREVQKRRGRSKAEEDGLKPPGKVLVRKVIAATQAEDSKIELDEMFVLALRWMQGEVSPQKIKGLSAAIRQIEGNRDA